MAISSSEGLRDFQYVFCPPLQSFHRTGFLAYPAFSMAVENREGGDGRKAEQEENELL